MYLIAEFPQRVNLVRISQMHHIGQQSANTDCNSTVVCIVEMGSQAVVMNIQSLNCSIVAERLSARLLILQCVFSVGGVWL